MEFKLELVLVPVTDVDRAKSFYVEQAGFNLEVDTPVGENMRVVQVTPPGSTPASRTLGAGTPGPSEHRHPQAPRPRAQSSLFPLELRALQALLS
jgi:hypothetical protein